MEKIKITVDQSEVNEALEKVERLQDALKEAKSLADELASRFPDMTIYI